MPALPGLPRLFKGALIAVGPSDSSRNVVVFQYNPDTMTRRLEARAVSQEGDRGEAFRLTGTADETITLNAELDVTDQLAVGDQLALDLGLHPTLAALEIMLYPSSATVIQNDALASRGIIEVIPVEGPMLLFVWGETRVLPVRITSFSVTEEAYDGLLNPIRAKVDLSLKVLSYNDLPMTGDARFLFQRYHVAKEKLAGDNRFNNQAGTGVTLAI
ncbi:MAG: hypothetical protein MUC34_01100 [Anaerolineae bacterium]|jgi:hypothetical protein|nr:hypothetical protein [Anaerolineae bacterium]